jgi:group I intron endonuclease
MDNYIVYEHKNKINGKSYIGITKQRPSARWRHGKGYTKNKHFDDAIQKYGWDNFEHKILFEKMTVEEALFTESFLIEQYDLTNPLKGYNISKGGSQKGPNNFEKMTEWMRTHKKFGEKNVLSKKVRCIETGDIFGSVQEACRWCNSSKVGECCRGNKLHSGHHPETGQLLTWEFVEDNSIVTIECHEIKENPYKKNSGKSKKVRCIETNEIFNSETEACQKYGYSTGSIGKVCNGQRKTIHNKHWEWILDKEEEVQ